MDKTKIKLPNLRRELVPGKIIYEVVVGDHVKGTTSDKSEVEFKGVYIAHEDNLYSNKIRKVFLLNKNAKYFEIGHFLTMLRNNDFEAIEMMYVPVDFISAESQELSTFTRGRRNSFLKNVFAKLIVEKVKLDMLNICIQREKATAVIADLNKKRKVDILDHMYAIDSRMASNKSGILPIKDFFKKVFDREGKNIKNYMTSPIEGTNNLRRLYYDYLGERVKGLVDKDNKFIDYTTSKTDLSLAIIWVDTEAINRETYKYLNNLTIDNVEYEGGDWVTCKDNIFLYNPERFSSNVRLLNIAFEYMTIETMDVYRMNEHAYFNSIKNNDQNVSDILVDMNFKIREIDIALQKKKVDKLVPEIFRDHSVIACRKQFYGKSKSKKANNVKEYNYPGGQLN